MKDLSDLLHSSQFDELNNMVRWNGFNRIKDETVGHHSFIVSWITRIIVENLFTESEPKLQATTYAIFHDFNEYITGDVNHNVKYNPYNGNLIRDELNNYIKNYVDEEYPKDSGVTNRLLNSQLTDSVPPYIKSIVKVADWMSMLMYLMKEKSLGNSNANDRINYCSNKLEDSITNCIKELNIQKDFIVNYEFLKI